MGHRHPSPERLQGRSFEPLLRGQTQADRDFVILQYNENSGGFRHPMRGIATREFLYLYNPWSDGERKFATATTGTVSYRQMVKRAANEPAIAARLDLFDHRVVEELYHVAKDPDCLVNLVDAAEHRATLERLRQTLAESLARLADPVAPLVFEVGDAEKRNAYMRQEDARSLALRKSKQSKNATRNGRQAGRTNAVRRVLSDRQEAGAPQR
jgi:N-sulfoglucosamine sulfohydrolase